MIYSTVKSKGKTTTIRVHPGIRSLRGTLASKKGRRMSFRKIREAAAQAARVREALGE